MFTSLVENSRLNDERFVCINAAVWNKSGQDLSLTVEKDHPGRSTLKGGAQLREQSRFSVERTESITIDDVYRTLPKAAGVLIVKLDVVGAEVEALEGSPSVLENLDLLIYEDRGKESEARVSRAVMELGLRVFFCDPTFQVREVPNPSSVQALKRDPKRGYNFFACRSDSRAYEQLSRLVGGGDT